MSREDEIRTALQTVRNDVAVAARSAGRDPASVTLVAVSKTRPPEDIRAALAVEQRDFGENYAQELRDKADTLPPRAPGTSSARSSATR